MLYYLAKLKYLCKEIGMKTLNKSPVKISKHVNNSKFSILHYFNINNRQRKGSLTCTLGSGNYARVKKFKSADQDDKLVAKVIGIPLENLPSYPEKKNKEGRSLSVQRDTQTKELLWRGHLVKANTTEVGKVYQESKILNELGLFVGLAKRQLNHPKKFDASKHLDCKTVGGYSEPILISSKYYIIMKRIPGQCLYDWIAQSTTASTHYYWSILLSCATAVLELHDRNIIHCDIKPENFMLNIKYGIAKAALIDFGTAKKLPIKTHYLYFSSFFGSMGYAAPESEYGIVTPTGTMRAYSKHSDIYQLGKTFQFITNYLLRVEDSIPESLTTLMAYMCHAYPEYRPNIHQVKDEMVHIFNAEQHKMSARTLT